MPFILAPGITYCETDGARIFLDLPGDRYFGLGADADTAFETLIAGVSPTDGQATALARLVVGGVLINDPTGATPRPAPSVPITIAPIDDAGPPSPRLGMVLAAVWRLQRAKQELRRLGLARSVARIAEIRERHRTTLRAGEPDELARIAAGFSAACRLVGAFEQCLPLSIAIARFGLVRRIDVTVCLGVRVRPLQAHAWAMAGTTLLSDRIETVRQFTPILVV